MKMKYWIPGGIYFFLHVVAVTVGNPIVLVSSPGQFTSPNFPRRYPARSNSTWYVIASPGYRIEIDFQDVDIEFSGACEHDRLVVTELTESEEIALGRICGRLQNPRKYLTKGHYLIVKFVTDTSVQRSGFTANFSFIGRVDKTISSTTELNPTTSAKIENTTIKDSKASTTVTTVKSTFQVVGNDGLGNEVEQTFAAISSHELFYPNANVVFPLLTLNILLLIALVLLAIYTCRLRRLRLSASKSVDAQFLVNPNYEEKYSNDGQFRRLGESQLSLNFDHEQNSSMRTERGRQNMKMHGADSDSKTGSKTADMMYSVIEDILPTTERPRTERSRKSLPTSVAASATGNTREVCKSPSYSLARVPSSDNDLKRDQDEEDPEKQDCDRYSQVDLEEDMYDHTESSNRISQDIYAKVEHDRHNCRSHHECDISHSFKN